MGRSPDSATAEDLRRYDAYASTHRNSPLGPSRALHLHRRHVCRTIGEIARIAAASRRTALCARTRATGGRTCRIHSDSPLSLDPSYQFIAGRNYQASAPDKPPSYRMRWKPIGLTIGINEAMRTSARPARSHAVAGANTAQQLVSWEPIAHSSNRSQCDEVLSAGPAAHRPG
jgi:hypothetical protein